MEGESWRVLFTDDIILMIRQGHLMEGGAMPTASGWKNTRRNNQEGGDQENGCYWYCSPRRATEYTEGP